MKKGIIQLSISKLTLEMKMVDEMKSWHDDDKKKTKIKNEKKIAWKLITSNSELSVVFNYFCTATAILFHQCRRVTSKKILFSHFIRMERMRRWKPVKKKHDVKERWSSIFWFPVCLCVFSSRFFENLSFSSMRRVLASWRRIFINFNFLF